MTSSGGVSSDLVSSRAATVRLIPPLSPAEPLSASPHDAPPHRHRTVTRLLTLVQAATLLALCAAGGAQASPTYQGSARSLALRPDETGYSSVQSATARPPGAQVPGIASRWTTGYVGSDDRAGSAIVYVMVFKTEAAASEHFEKASGAAGADPAGWRYKVAARSQGGLQTAAVLGVCHNVAVAAVETAPVSTPLLSRASRYVIGLTFEQAAILGMDSCAVPSERDRGFWSENEAEQTVLSKLRIPTCYVYELKACQRQGGQRVSRADCTGADENGSTFEYARFTCTIEVRDGYGGLQARGRVAIYPTRSSFHWVLLG